MGNMSGDELTAAIRRSRRRGYLDKQLSENSSLISGDDREGVRVSTEQETSDRVRADDNSDRVRFDDNVSFIEAETQEKEAEHTRMAGKKQELEAAGTLREETDEELAQIVSPEPKRPLLQPPSTPSFTSIPPPLASSSSSIPPPLATSFPYSPLPRDATVVTICDTSSDNSFLTDDTNVSTITVNDMTDTASNVTLVTVGLDNNTASTILPRDSSSNLTSVDGSTVSSNILDSGPSSRTDSVRITVAGEGRGSDSSSKSNITEAFSEVL